MEENPHVERYFGGRQSRERKYWRTELEYQRKRKKMPWEKLVITRKEKAEPVVLTLESTQNL